MAGAPDKQAAFADSIAERLRKDQDPKFANLANQLAKAIVTIEAIGARLALFESATNTATTTTKRTARTSKKGAAPKAVGAKKKAATSKKGSSAPFANNTMHWFKHLLLNDLEGVRETYLTEKNIEALKNHKDVKNKSREKDEAKYFAGYGSALWSTFDDAEKLKFRTSLDAWNEQSNRNAAKPQLEEDAEAVAEEEEEVEE